MNKTCQIEWLKNWCNEQINKTGRVYIDSNNLELAALFEESTEVVLSHSVWKSRIREVAKDLNLNGYRLYNADASPHAGIPRFTMVYTNN